MTITEAVELIQKYAECPKCGNSFVGGGNGENSVDIDTKKGYFKRTCECGWSVEVKK